MTGPLSRVARQVGDLDLVELLAGLAPSDLQSVMLEVYRRQAAAVSPAELLTRYQDSRFCRPAGVGPAALSAFEASAWSLLPEGYEAIELSPLCPLGACAAVATVDQNKIVSTVRNVEVVADTTNVLALESALQRRAMLADPARRSLPVGLAACQPQVRAQALSQPRSWAHFRLLAVTESGRDRGGFTFEAAALRRQIAYFVSLIGQLRRDWTVEVAFTDLAGRPRVLEQAVAEPIGDQFPGVRVRMDPERVSGRGYYLDACYKLFAVDADGDRVELGDGGCTVWTRRLLSDDKERLVIGGLGVDRLLM
ncbi:MAG TPA: hypothetical protein VFA11_07180 [Acidimicrobiales bacterium]|nr:hypothetical protein [Acidimicrobiales bacterium]